jgi:hypothetical protein
MMNAAHGWARTAINNACACQPCALDRGRTPCENIGGYGWNAGKEMDETNRNLATALEGVDELKRTTLSGLVSGAFVAPMVASFAMTALRRQYPGLYEVEIVLWRAQPAASRSSAGSTAKIGVARVEPDSAGLGLSFQVSMERHRACRRSCAGSA